MYHTLIVVLSISLTLYSNKVSGYSSNQHNAPGTFLTIAQEESREAEKERKRLEKLKKARKQKALQEAKRRKHYQVTMDGLIYSLSPSLQDYTYRMCKKYGIEKHYRLILAQMFHESRYQAEIISPTNDYGLMQINICNHQALKKKLGITNFLDEKQSIHAGVYLMSGLLKKYSPEKALSCYNLGEPKVNRRGITSSIYSRGVMKDYCRMKLIERRE